MCVDVASDTDIHDANMIASFAFACASTHVQEMWAVFHR